MIANKKFLYFFILNFFDKIMIFLLPFSILFFFKDKKLYNEVEIVYSVSIILYIFADGGIKNYSLAFFRNSKNKLDFIKEKMYYVNSITLFYLILFFPILIIFFVFNNYNFFFILILFRVIFLIFSNYFKVYFSMIKNQLKMLNFTIAASSTTLLYILYIKYSGKILGLFEFFIFQMIITISLILYNIFQVNLINLSKLKKIYFESIKFSLPLIINAFVFLITMHFIKIYSYNFLSEDTTTKIAFLMRIMLIIQFSHGAFSNYFMRNFFETKKKKFDLKIIFNYLLLISLVSIMLITFYPYFLKIANLNYEIDLIFILIFLYTILWCIAAFLEQYLNKFYKNKYILIYSLISLTTYITTIFIFNNIDMITRISMAMIFSIIVYFTLILKKIIELFNER